MPLAPLDRLPTEILEEIFKLSLWSLDLPLASPHLASKLASNHCYLGVCSAYLSAPIGDRILQTKIQSRIFACRFMTWEFFKTFITRSYEEAGCVCGNDGCWRPIWPPAFSDPASMQFTMGHLPQLSYIKCRIPMKLLHGPWTEERTQFLRFLIETSSMTVDWADKETRRLAVQGKKEAILTRNHNVVDLFNHNRRLGKPPSLDLVQFAVLEGGCDRTIVFDIMNTARTWGFRHWASDVLDDWVKKAVKEGNPKGAWLRVKLEELRSGKALTSHAGNYEMEGDVLQVRDNGGSRVNEVRSRVR
ncbi:uncharacterized protein BDZ99DRAFT_431710 [Mytilinidion resinicola]|uniref:Uncharacterized protein n=1 Tax=Mytilinidion resinicola TaxID=574789 RepID=A0A6A6Z955_9PEZI|nr:uncharacterized protein BDZ99DRAFT_431710 [Mytilinidion resinicola]KAF2817546.1 hypothetical protein BDZ99DRAFT_431710 [Mytilinidion resinicola]